MWCLKMFYEGFKGLYKTFWDTSKKCENKNLIFISIQLSEMHCTKNVKLQGKWQKFSLQWLDNQINAW